MNLELSARAEITLPRKERDLLMYLASSRTAPSAPVLASRLLFWRYLGLFDGASIRQANLKSFLEYWTTPGTTL